MTDDTDLNLEGLAGLDLANLDDTYVGRAGRCGCGCSGTYRDRLDPESAKVLRRVQRKARLHPETIWHYRYGDGSERWGYSTASQIIAVNSSPTDPDYYKREREKALAAQAANQAALAMGEGI